ncbi:MAG: hypothetical protein M0036_05695 [Desulfobacteraceae bacterium]|nr:hypothetical protein [Desulfobacteraceae bacterium]
MTGSQFLNHIEGMDKYQREEAIFQALLQGNLPDFLRQLKPVTIRHRFDDGHWVTATVFVMPDYLAIGSNSDFVRIPMNLHTARKVAARFGFNLPTEKIVDAIYCQSEYHYQPQPMRPGPQMRSTTYYRIHNQKIQKQRKRLGIPLNALVCGHKKDVVITNQLRRHDDRIAIYGWHTPGGEPIQPLSTVHGAGYVDYSHGIRLVSDLVLIDGQPRSLCAIMEDPELAAVVSYEGVIVHARQWMGHPDQYLSKLFPELNK